jgi:hypothetical protein
MANDVRRFFDARTLTEQDLSMIQFVLMSPAYEIAFKPYLENVRESMRELWLDRSKKRQDEYNDDFLAGGVATIEGLLKFFTAVCSEANFERMHEAMAGMVPERQYELKRQAGKVAPIVGVDQPAMPAPYDPMEDF